MQTRTTIRERVPITVIRFLGLGLLLQTSVACTSMQPFSQPYFTVGVGGVYGGEDFDLSDAERASGTKLDADGSGGVDARVGYRFHPLAAIEVQGQIYDEFEIDAVGGPTAEVDMTSVSVNLKLFTDVGDFGQVYGLVGLGVLWADLDNSVVFLREFDDQDMTGRVGLGFESPLTQQLNWFVEGVLTEPFDELDGLTVYSVTLGLQLGL